MRMEPFIRLQNLSAPSLNMELFSVIQGSWVGFQARTHISWSTDETTLYHALIDYGNHMQNNAASLGS